MRNSLPISLKKLRQDNLAELFRILERTFKTLDIRYYVLGALARDTWYAAHDVSSRATRDIDLAVYVFSGNQYDRLIEELAENEGFRTIKNVPFRLITPFDITIDLIPFGIESVDGKFEFEKGWDRPVYINGFEEVANKATVKAIDEQAGVEFRAASLPAILMLKLISYDDRPEHRTQDPPDIRDIILNFFDIEDMVIYEEHNDLFDRNLELHEYAAIVIGREMKLILAENDSLRHRILTILSLEEPTQIRMCENMSDDKISLKQVKKWMTLIREGVNTDNEHRTRNTEL